MAVPCLDHAFYDRAVLLVARDLLGAVVRHDGVSVRLTEVEAYDGVNDPASHAYRGRTRRNAVMFGPPGHLYVYFTYGMHHCANVVCGPEGTSAAVLLRAGEVTDGIELARARRLGVTRDHALARGPACLVRALGLGPEHNGVDITGSSPVTLRPGPVLASEYRTGPRVGVRLGATRPWRLWLPDEPSVSTYRAAGRRGP
ncbi:MAG: DNA-3-methyladenine glycosylase [Sporichthyaceae bacterium]